MCGRYNLISNLTVRGDRFEFDPSQLMLEWETRACSEMEARPQTP